MKKNLYSLTLSDDVVREVDALAHRMGTNRSALVNQILAEYVSVPTPERRWNDIFEAIEELMTPTRELVPFFISGAMSSICSIMLSNPSGLTALYPAFVSISRSSSHMRTSSSTTITHFTVYSTLSGVIIAMRYLLLERFTAVI